MYTQPASRKTEQYPGCLGSAEDGCSLTGHDQPLRVDSGERLSIVAHDMRNYLTPMRMRAGLLLRRAVKEHREADVRDVAALEKAIERLNLLVSNLVEDARLDAGLFTVHRRKVDLVELAHDSAAVLSTDAVRVCVEAPTRTLVALVDPERIRQALDNLVANAVRHSPDQDVALIRVARDDPSETACIKLTVEDQGPGIPIEVLPSLFAPFITGPGSQGLGLGLYLARQCAIAHGGSLNVEPIPGRGGRLVLALRDDD